MLDADQIDKLLLAVNVEFAIELLGMPTYGIFGQVERLGDVAFCPATTQQMHHFFFAFGQVIEHGDCGNAFVKRALAQRGSGGGGACAESLP